jgi:hypothetical protein
MVVVPAVLLAICPAVVRPHQLQYTTVSWVPAFGPSVDDHGICHPPYMPLMSDAELELTDAICASTLASWSKAGMH